jgi:hypothetical protein
VKKVVLALILVLGLLSSASAATYTYDFIAVEDTFVNSLNPDTNYSSAGVLEVGDDTTIQGDPNPIPNYDRTFARWADSDISSVVGDSVTNAYIKLYCTNYSDLDSTSGNNYVTMHQVESAWTETGLTWNTHLNAGNPIFQTSPIESTQNVTASSAYTWDVTDLFIDWWTGIADNFGVAFVADLPNSEEIWAEFGNREDSNYDLRPLLHIETYEEGGNGGEVPEPATMILLGSLATGLFSVAGIRRKK